MNLLILPSTIFSKISFGFPELASCSKKFLFLYLLIVDLNHLHLKPKGLDAEICIAVFFNISDIFSLSCSKLPMVIQPIFPRLSLTLLCI